MKARATVIFARDQRVLLVRKPKSKWALPGGSLKAGETVTMAAARELHEETGLVSEDLLFIFQFQAAHKTHHVFEATCPDTQFPSPYNEISECIWQSFGELDDLEISDATKAIIRSFVRRL